MIKLRIVSLVTALALILSVNSFVTADAAEAEDYSSYINSLVLLEAMKIAEKDIDMTANITRAQAAKYIVAMLNENTNLEAYRGIFTDVNSENENVREIEKLCDLGIVRGDGNYRYRPDDNLTYIEAMWIFVKVLGYGAYENLDSELFKIVQTEGLMNNVKQEYDVVNMGDFFTMMYNTFIAHPFMRDKWGSEDKYYYISDSTLLYHLYEIVYDRGVIVKNDLTWLWSSVTDNTDTVGIHLKNGTNLELFTEDMNPARDDIGKMVNVFYKYDEDDNRNEYICHMAEKNKTVNIPLASIDTSTTNFDKCVLNYYVSHDDANAKTLKLAPDYSLLFNNVAYKSHKMDFAGFGNKVGNIELIDADRDNTYETVKVKVFDSLVVDRKSLDYNYITDKFDPSKSVDTDEDNYKKIFAYNKEGNEITVSDINPGSVISVAISDALESSDNVLEIYVSDGIENGKITGYDSESVPAKITIDYENIYPVYDRAVKDSYMNNRNVIVYTDFMGNIIYVKDDAELGINYGLITRVKKGISGLDDEVKVRYINGSGKVVEAKLSENVIVDGRSYKKNISSAADKLLSAIVSVPEDINVNGDIIPVRYEADKNGNLKMIDTLKSDEQNERDLFTSTGAGCYGVYAQYIFGWDIPFSSDATVLEIFSDNPMDKSEFEVESHINVSVASKVFRTGNEKRSVFAFKSDKDSIYSDFVIYFTTENFEYGTQLFIVDDIATAFNESLGTTMTMLKGYSKGAYVTVYANDETTANYNELIKLKKGDVIRYIANLENCVMSYQNVLTKNNDGTQNLSTISGHGFGKQTPSSATLVCGYVYLRQGSVIQMSRYGFGTFTPGADLIDWGTTAKVYAGLPETASYVVVNTDKTSGRTIIKPGTADSIKDCRTFDEEGSMVLLRFRGGTLQEAIIYN